MADKNDPCWPRASTAASGFSGRFEKNQKTTRIKLISLDHACDVHHAGASMGVS